MEEDGVENVWAKTLSQATYLLDILFIVMLCFFYSRSRSWVFLGMIATDSHSRIVGMDFFHCLPVPEFREWIFFIPFPFLNLLLLSHLHLNSYNQNMSQFHAILPLRKLL